MRARAILPVPIALAAAACLVPVDDRKHTVTTCVGDCPMGTCDDSCAALDGGKRDDMVTALLAAWCARDGGTSKPCSAYRPDTYPEDLSAPRCSLGALAYCVVTAGGRSFSVFCADAGTRTVECTRPCDAGTPDAARSEDCAGCPKIYCMRT